jgi:aldehyde:ferredoxin oxidoreductase
MQEKPGRILCVDLTSKKIDVMSLSPDIYVEFLGGYGLGAKFIYDHMRAGVDPLGPENILGFTTGVLVGTPAISGNRFTVCAKSPLTSTWGDSNCGGYWAPALRRAGFDAVFISGTSESPVYLYIDNGKVEIRQAEDLWGKDTTETEQTLKERHGSDVQIASIGPAGEKQSLIAAIIHDRGRAAGRSGLGAVMGSKQLKAIVVRGNLEVPMADPEAAKKLRNKWIKDLLSRPSAQKFRKYGTIDHVASSTFSNDAPVKNWAGVGLRDFPQATAISDDNVLKYEKGKYACWQCPLVCGGIYEVSEGPYKTAEAHKPEYETCAMFGSNLLNDNLESIIALNDLCNRLGLDTISTAATIAFAMECFEKGLITAKDTGNINLTWGNHQAIVTAVKMIGQRQGPLGELLADGSRVAAQRIGGKASEYAIQIQGQELAAHDPRYGPSWGTYYKVDATPGRHTQIGLVVYENGGGIPGLDLGKIVKYQFTGKGAAAAKVQNLMHALYSAGLCMQVILRSDINCWPEFLQAVTGEVYPLARLEETGARIAALRQAFNIREGLKVTEFQLPGRSYGNPPLDAGPLEGIVIDVDTMAREYYEAQHWDPATGKPTPERLAALGLSYVIPDLYEH